MITTSPACSHPRTPLQTLRVLLVLGRMSNLPTVWSNCLAAWLLAGSGRALDFGLVCGGATLLYTGGMFLNDAFDVEFDRQYRPERPIVSGQIAARTVWLISAALLSLGWLAVVPLGRVPAGFGALLIGMIIIYDGIHKWTRLAPVLMAGCRFLLYLLAASAVHRVIGSVVIQRGAVLAVYILGLSYVARGESKPAGTTRWPVPLLFAPVAMALVASKGSTLSAWVMAAVQGGWVLWCLRGADSRFHRYLNVGVSGLLAGIVLVDWLATAGQSMQLSPFFALLLLSALMSQRLAPAT